MADHQQLGWDRGAAVGRRDVIKSAGLGAAAVAVATGAAGPAFAALGTVADDARVTTFEARYAIHGGAIIAGYFAASRSRDLLDTVILLPGPAGVTPALKTAAQRQALGGAFVIVPDLPANASGAARRAGHDAMVAEFVAHAPSLRHLPRSTGRVRILAA